ncbi:MAG: potassium-transporting ATPase subunit C [Deltaproteobacteria bacterium 13_1_40CM_4_68_19]|nr:MAG: potassium-transporting ATPase subunit C [Deltaproteobacteria bacterium 13_1_40CM_4_68_19]
MLRNELLAAVRTTLVTLIGVGLAYPLVTTAVAGAIFPQQASGSMVSDDYGNVVGSGLIAQPFAKAGYLQPRPSAAGEKGYDAAGSSGSNLGPTSKALRDRAAKDLQRLIQENPNAEGPVPAELVSASASGLDPHLSPAAALWQVPRIARARGVEESRVRTIIESNIEGRDLLVLGEPRVNVLLVNRALDRHFGRPPLATR